MAENIETVTTTIPVTVIYTESDHRLYGYHYSKHVETTKFETTKGIFCIRNLSSIVLEC